MENIPIKRRLEFWIVLSAMVSYCIRTLLWSAWNFEDMIRTARHRGVPVNKILENLRSYEHTVHYNIPFILAAVSIFGAWYLFHFKVFPKVRQESFDRVDLYRLLFTIALILAAATAMGHIKSLQYLYDDQHEIIGFRVFSEYRKRYVLSDSATLLAVILVYEMLFKFLDRVYLKSQTRFGQRKLNHIILAGLCCLLFLFTISWGILPSLFYSIASRQVWAFLLFLILVYLLQDYYYRKVYEVMHNPHPSRDRYHPVFLFTFAFILGTFLMWAIMARFRTNAPTFVIFASMALYFSSMVIAYLRKNRQEEQAILQTEVSVKSAEIMNLRSQINPHFLFNALNSLYATALKENSEQTADGIQKLGDMMRFMLDENNHDRIPLRSEIAYLHNYLEIQRMRLDENQHIEVRVNMQEVDKAIEIAPMLLNPFIENAFKHGISFQNQSWIYITLTMDDTRIYFKVHNSLHKSTGADPEKDKGGIGLENVRKRLELIYPNKHSLHIQQSDGDFFIALTLDYI